MGTARAVLARKTGARGNEIIRPICDNVIQAIEPNGRNARHSTRSITEQGKLRSGRNAVRHRLTAKTVIGALAHAEHYDGVPRSRFAGAACRGTRARGIRLLL